MARPREFDETKALDCAVELFRQQGYEATSVRDLTEHMQISRQSLYNTFGDKHQLFLSALDRYRDQSVAAFLEVLGGPDASLPEIQTVFENLVTSCTRISTI